MNFIPIPIINYSHCCGLSISIQISNSFFVSLTFGRAYSFLQSVEKFPAKGAIKKESENGTVTEMGRGPPTQVEEDLGRELKRKKLNYDHQDTVIKTGIHESIVLNSQNVLMSNSKSEPKLGVPVSDAQPSAASDCLGANSMAVCAFCQSSRLSEVITHF